MTDNYLCLHGHFYQPPRENPWLGVIELQSSAHPFHDWNERITRECYAPNARARVLGAQDRIVKLINNYEYLSFNFGPTLLSWLEQGDPWTYSQILAADEASRARNQGHGNALAQVYNHIIMPLANRRDKLTQIRWGVADFERRFGRKPEGMWLAETAVDLETLHLMAEEGILFTILAPNQAHRVRSIAPDGSTGPWEDVSGGRIDPRQPYRCVLPDAGGRSMNLFFYDGSTSRAVAYERLLTSGAGFLSRIQLAYGEANGRTRLVNLATDGESYGHHSRFGEMALAWVLDEVSKNGDIRLINYGAYLEMHPPEFEVQIIENTSWSCAHGLGRWQSDCGCNVGHTPGWTQAWRTPLREAVNWLGEELAVVFEQRGGELLKDPWAARDDYISVLVQPTPEVRDAFLNRHARQPLDPDRRREILALMESQVMSLFMFTSCGWFFDDISGLEPIQNMKYAARAIDLVRPWVGGDLEDEFLRILAGAKSNLPEYGDGARIYREWALPGRLDPSRVAAHYALRRVVQDGDVGEGPVSQLARPLSQRRLSGAGQTAVFGELRVADPRVEEEHGLAFLALHDGGVGLSCLVASSPGPDLDEVTPDIRRALEDSNPSQAVEAFMRRAPGSVQYELMDLIPDARNDLVRVMLLDVHAHFMDWIRNYFDTHRDLVALLRETKVTVPEIQGCLFRLVAGDQLIRHLDAGDAEASPRWAELLGVVHQVGLWGLSLKEPAVNRRASSFVLKQIRELANEPDAAAMTHTTEFLRAAKALVLELDLWESQNIYDGLRRDSDYMARLSPEGVSALMDLGRELGFLIKGDGQ